MQVFRILVVCTGNRCRSPAAERMLAVLLVDRHRAAFDLDSAGTAAAPGLPVHPLTAAGLARRGVSVDGHRSAPLTSGQVHDADLVLTAERRHRDAVVAIDNTSAPRVFTIIEFARTVLRVAAPDAPTSPAALVAAAARARFGHPDGPGADDLPDPVTGGPPVHETVLVTVQRSVTGIAAAFAAAEPG